MGLDWGPEQTVNDAPNSGATDQFQPSMAAGPHGAVAVAFYDRRAVCPSDASILPAHHGAADTCIDISLQAYKDHGAATGAVHVGGNVRVSQFSWDPDQPQQLGADPEIAPAHQADDRIAPKDQDGDDEHGQEDPLDAAEGEHGEG